MVCIVDDDLSVRRAVRRLLRSAGYTVETYGSARDFLATEPEGRTALAILDVRMEGMTGFDLQEELAARHSAIPIMPRHANAFDAPVGSVWRSPSRSRHCSAPLGGSASRFDDPTDADRLVVVQIMFPLTGMRPL